MVTFRNEPGKIKHDRVEVWPAEVKDGDLRNLLHKIEGLVSYRRAKITV